MQVAFASGTCLSQVEHASSPEFMLAEGKPVKTKAGGGLASRRKASLCEAAPWQAFGGQEPTP
eukprot:10458508-Alexandrium_andersonii.AAC.1